MGFEAVLFFYVQICDFFYVQFELSFSSLALLSSNRWVVSSNNRIFHREMYISCDHKHLNLKWQLRKRSMEVGSWCKNIIFWLVTRRVMDCDGSHFHCHKTNCSICFKCKSNLRDFEYEFRHFLFEQDQYICNWMVSLELNNNF